MITTANYYKEVAKIGVTNLPETLRKSHEFVEKVSQQGSSWATYNGSDQIKRTIDLYFTKLHEFTAAQPAAKIPAVKSKPTVVAKSKPKVVAKSKTPEPKNNHVERISEDVAIIKRYISMHGKERTKTQCVNLLKALQKAILEKRIGKHSIYGQEVMQIQDSLLILERDKAESFKIVIGDESLEKYREIIDSVSPMVSISLLKRYVGLIGKKDIKDKVQRLSDHFKKAMDKGYVQENDKYIHQVKNAYTNLQNFIAGKSKTLLVEQAELNGLNTLGFLPLLVAAGAAGAAQAVVTNLMTKKAKAGTLNSPSESGKPFNGKGLVNSPNEVMSVSDAKSQQFKTLGLTGDLRKLIGDACEPTSIFIYGNGGSGKSSLSLIIASALNRLGKSVLYIAGEQFGTPTFSKLLEVTQVAGNDRFKIVRGLHTLPIGNFDVIAIDSKDSVGLTASSDFKAMRDMYPSKNWLITSQGTKAGDFAGDEKWRNEVDCMIYCEKGVASTLVDKNRWGGKAEMRLFGA